MSERQSDYAMALDLLSQLNQFRTEAEVIHRLLEILAMLFAPGELYFVRFDAKSPAGVYRPYREEVPAGPEEIALCDFLSGTTRVRELGTGLAMPLDFLGQRLGIAVLDDFALQDRREGYRDLARAVAPICSLSLSNARNFEELRRDEAALRAKQDDLVRMLGLRDRLFSIIGHDLKGPIGSMRELLRIAVRDLAGSLPPEHELLLAEILRASDGIYFLLANLLEWGRAQSMAVSLKPESLGLRDCVEEIFGLLGVQASAKEVLLRNEVDPSFFLVADSTTIQTILRNLVSNGLKFTPFGGSVTVRAEVEGDESRVRVIDSGLGMDASELAHALDLSNRRPSTGTNGERGLGLGLILCHEFAERNGGKLRIESEPGRGTAVTLAFPSVPGAGDPGHG